MADFLSWMHRVPAPVVYLLLGLGAAVENVVPAIPADTFVALGGFLSAVGDLDARWIFLATWSLNVGSALAMYRVGFTHGRSFFTRGWGRWALRPHQMERMTRFYERWGIWAVFWTRFLPGFRAVVPIFAGVTHQRALPVAIPLATASAIWYGALVWLGALTGHNLDALRTLLTRTSGALTVVALITLLAVGLWWWRTRRPRDE